MTATLELRFTYTGHLTQAESYAINVLRDYHDIADAQVNPGYVTEKAMEGLREKGLLVQRLTPGLGGLASDFWAEGVWA